MQTLKCVRKCVCEPLSEEHGEKITLANAARFQSLRSPFCVAANQYQWLLNFTVQ